jgi:hypothetical protein
VTVRDVAVQIGFLMVTAGAMLAAWAVFTGQFRRGEPEPGTAEDAKVAERKPPVRAARPRAPSGAKKKTTKTTKKAPPRKRRPSA